LQFDRASLNTRVFENARPASVQIPLLPRIDFATPSEPNLRHSKGIRSILEDLHPNELHQAQPTHLLQPISQAQGLPQPCYLRKETTKDERQSYSCTSTVVQHNIQYTLNNQNFID
jgi:hypothetical protein